MRNFQEVYGARLCLLYGLEPFLRDVFSLKSIVNQRSKEVHLNSLELYLLTFKKIMIEIVF